MKRPSPYEFTTGAEYLRAVRASLPRASGRYARWSRTLGYRSPRSVAMVLKGQRLPSATLLERLAGQLRLSLDERRYLGLLVDRERRVRRGLGTASLDDRLAALHPRTVGRTTITLDGFAPIADWHHVVLKQLVATPGFREDRRWIRARLDRALDEAEIATALETLVARGLLRRDAAGRLAVAPEGLRTPSDRPSAAIRRHHRQMLVRALEAIGRRPVDAREVCSLTLRCRPAAMKEAKELIRRFKREFEERFHDGTADEVYQLNVQFFPHTVRRGSP